MQSIGTEALNQITILGLLYARVVPILMFVPLFSSSVLNNNLVRNAFILAVLIGIWPSLDININPENLSLLELSIIAGKEAVVGTAMGMVMGIPFWIFNAMGSYIDVARGASMGNLLAPTNGQESTETSNFIDFCVCAIFIEMNGMNIFVDALQQSYHFISIGQTFSIDLPTTFKFLGEIVKQAFILSSPVLFVLLLVDILLGVLSAFTPQLNAFMVSMTVKSFIGVVVLALYLMQSIPVKLDAFMSNYRHTTLILPEKK